MIENNFRVESYDENFHEQWEQLVAISKNGIFQNQRKYLAYHNSPQKDESLIVLEGDKCVALLPIARVNDQVVCSHSGAAFGGFVTQRQWHLEEFSHVMFAILRLLREKGYRSLEYRPVPDFMHIRKFTADQEFLVKLGSSVKTMLIPNQVETLLVVEQHRSHNVKKAMKQNLSIKPSTNFERSYKVLVDNLWSKHQTQPTHSLDELKYLLSNFKDSIKCFDVVGPVESEILATAIVYSYATVNHIQYLGSTPEGRANFAVDFMIDSLKSETKESLRSFLSFGHSLKSTTSPFINYGLFRYKFSQGFKVIPSFHHQIDLEEIDGD